MDFDLEAEGFERVEHGAPPEYFQEKDETVFRPNIRKGWFLIRRSPVKTIRWRMRSDFDVGGRDRPVSRRTGGDLVGSVANWNGPGERARCRSLHRRTSPFAVNLSFTNAGPGRAYFSD
ncbi:MAG: hypothetical protein J0I23_14770 [Rhizobiales bacterium]|nr:hypothetical protein [Hyphomicrobiales bacterium]